MSGAVNCPSCQRALPDSVLTGPAQAVVRCEGCATLLLWSHGKVVRSARSNSSTLMGMPVQKAGAPAPSAAAKPMAKTLMGMPTPNATEGDPIPEPPAPAKKAPLGTQNLNQLGAKRDPILPARPAPPEKSVEKKQQITATVPQSPRSVPGPMENPAQWFDANADDEPTTVGPPPVADPLPPLDPQSTNLTAKKPEAKTAPASAPTLMAEAPVLPAPPKRELPKKPEPKPKVEAPLFKAEPKVEAPLFKAEPVKKAEPLPLPPTQPTMTLAAPPAASLPKTQMAPAPSRPIHPTPAPLGAVEQVLDLSPDRRKSPLVKYAAIAGGAAALVALVSLFVFGGSSKPDQPKTFPPPVAAAPPPAPVAPPPAPVAPPPAPVAPPPAPVAAAPPVAQPPAAPRVAAPPPVTTPPPEEEPPARKQPTRVAAAPRVREPAAEPAPRRRGRAKKVVLEYDPPRPTAPPPQEDAAQVERAREAYRRGNDKLFAGNSSGAVTAYKESLSIYPGYVAGYRGLGLAYAQLGNRAEALKALHTYIKMVPAAHDAPIIQKRIERLEKTKD